MQLTLYAIHPTPHGASCLVQAMSTWSVKTRRAPSRHCGNARVYSHTTTAMHDNEYTRNPPSVNAVRGDSARVTKTMATTKNMAHVDSMCSTTRSGQDGRCEQIDGQICVTVA